MVSFWVMNAQRLHQLRASTCSIQNCLYLKKKLESFVDSHCKFKQKQSIRFYFLWHKERKKNCRIENSNGLHLKVPVYIRIHRRMRLRIRISTTKGRYLNAFRTAFGKECESTLIELCSSILVFLHPQTLFAPKNISLFNYFFWRQYDELSARRKQRWIYDLCYRIVWLSDWMIFIEVSWTIVANIQLHKTLAQQLFRRVFVSVHYVLPFVQVVFECWWQRKWAN